MVAQVRLSGMSLSNARETVLRFLNEITTQRNAAVRTLQIDPLDQLRNNDVAARASAADRWGQPSLP
ncbi:hypothetical protein Caka_2712 [Coraliomargarita akajimensis DSM 45221]|uniref:Uncharacterized protein n=1 Tax=Coraliomargarita akajimensis (strain DSM 45221 / IAM 15411 / JCM 23193 / KCTC 12865 / 04OKA010-24) TaxID=583355 RepID=D5EPZ4_CORAD|nr:hypothetical protein Caka_2712 [Coraliomargarita akajimensis DSM 45221]